MPAPERPRGERISPVTLAIAAAASASAAFVVSRVWGTGTLIGAAVTPVIIAVVTELLRRPATRMPDVSRPAARPRRAPRGRPAAAPVHVYRAGPDTRRWGIAAATALGAFLLGVLLYVAVDRLAGGEGRLVPERRDAVPAQTVTTESRTVTVVTQQQTVTVTTVTVPRERTVTVTTPARTLPSTSTRTTATATTPVTAPPG